MENKELPIETEPFYWDHFQSCLSRTIMGGCGVMFGVSAGVTFTQQVMAERIPHSLRKYLLTPAMIIAGTTAFFYTRNGIQKCREEFFYLERKRAGAPIPGENMT